MLSSTRTSSRSNRNGNPRTLWSAARIAALVFFFFFRLPRKQEKYEGGDSRRTPNCSRHPSNGWVGDLHQQHDKQDPDRGNDDGKPGERITGPAAEGTGAAGAAERARKPAALAAL